MIDKKTIAHIAQLARLKINDEEAEKYSEQLSQAFNYFEQISKIETKNIEPLVTPAEITAFWREDEVRKELTANELTANAPDKLGDLFKVPPVV
jgi:aspartyl-tRNA(Asn)/glutamyl-tRNA(Gln) amidotransferase subunit C